MENALNWEIGLFAPYALMAYILVGISLYAIIRPHRLEDRGVAFEVAMLWICALWVFSVPYAFYYHRKMAKRVLNGEQQEQGS